MKRKVAATLVITAVTMTLGSMAWVAANSRADQPANAATTTTTNASTNASIATATCETGITATGVGFYTAQSLNGNPPPYDGNGDTQAGYQLTVTNDGSTPITMQDATVVSYNGNGVETGSDTESITGVVMPSQSLSWTLTPNNLPFESYNANADLIVDPGSACTVVASHYS
jgi:hypothetical protein